MSWCNNCLWQGLGDHMRAQGDRFDRVLALEPTGWACNKQFKSLAGIKPKPKIMSCRFLRITLQGKTILTDTKFFDFMEI